MRRRAFLLTLGLLLWTWARAWASELGEGGGNVLQAVIQDLRDGAQRRLRARLCEGAKPRPKKKDKRRR